MEISHGSNRELVLEYKYKNVEIVLYKRLEHRGDGEKAYKPYLKFKYFTANGEELWIMEGKIKWAELNFIMSVIRRRPILIETCKDIAQRFKLHVVHLLERKEVIWTQEK